MISIHDNNIYGVSLNCEHLRLTLHTEFTDRTPFEYTDVVFRDIVAHHIEHALSGNILFDVIEVAPEKIVTEAADLFNTSWKYGWPSIEYKGDLKVLATELQLHGICGFEISSSYGLGGWVFAKGCERVARELKAHIA